MIALVHPSARRFIPFFALLLALFVSGCGINNIPTLEEQAKAKWSDVQNQYQRRADLIPNLVETVKGYAKQEKEVLEAVINARARATQIQVNANTVTDPDTFKKFQEAQAQLSGALGRLIATVENYPDLKSNQNFLALQSQLEGTENRIAVARRDYIEAVRAYNTELRTLPGVDLGQHGLSQPQADGDLHRDGRFAEAAEREVLDRVSMRRLYAIVACAGVRRRCRHGARAIADLSRSSPAAWSMRPVFWMRQRASSCEKLSADLEAKIDRPARGGDAEVAAGHLDRGLRLSARPPMADRPEGQE